MMIMMMTTIFCSIIFETPRTLLWVKDNNKTNNNKNKTNLIGLMTTVLKYLVHAVSKILCTFLRHHRSLRLFDCSRVIFCRKLTVLPSGVIPNVCNVYAYD